MDLVHVSVFFFSNFIIIWLHIVQKNTNILDYNIAYIMFFMFKCKNRNVIIFLRYKYNYLSWSFFDYYICFLNNKKLEMSLKK